MRDFLKGVAAFFIMCFLIIAGFLGYIATRLSAPKDYPENNVYVLEAGYGANTIIADLTNCGFVKDYTVSKLYYKIFGDNYNFIAGTYILPKNASAPTIFKYISNGNNIVQETVRITFKEGEWLEDYAKKIAENVDNITEQELLDYWRNKDAYRDLMTLYPVLNTNVLNNDSIQYLYEGYLFPQTYDFFKFTTCEQVTRKMLNYTELVYETYQKDFDKAYEKLGLNVNQVFTLASIVQFEGNTKDNMQKIAGVFLNRLDDNYPLQSSVTVCYAIHERGIACETDAAREETATNPYNTYYNNGLPPGPICAPGEVALDAVLNPVRNNYYFFFADKAGNVYYALTYQQHLQNIATYGG